MAERQFGPYQLVKQIAVGGMAEIHLAKTKGIAGFEKFCALKMIHPNFAQDEQFIEMLIDEAKIAVQLQHVNIAQTFDLGRVGDTYYITMEFVDGADLYKILRRGSEQDVDMPVDVAAFIAKEMATGLDYAHRKRDSAGNNLGIVHRDVSPQNVLVSNAGEVKLVDFGIAKATMKVRQTAVGVIKGKYYYMSPEQAWGERLDHRSDIFSAGIVLYEMLTSQMLYLEEDLHKLLDMVRRANIEPVRTLRKDVPPQLERIVMHALAKKPEDRYQSAGDLASDLERFLHTYSPVFTASKLAVARRQEQGVTTELGHARLEGNPRAGGGLFENHGQGLVLQGQMGFAPTVYGLERVGAAQQHFEFVGGKVQQGQKMANRHEKSSLTGQAVQSTPQARDQMVGVGFFPDQRWQQPDHPFGSDIDQDPFFQRQGRKGGNGSIHLNADHEALVANLAHHGQVLQGLAQRGDQTLGGSCDGLHPSLGG